MKKEVLKNKIQPNHHINQYPNKNFGKVSKALQKYSLCPIAETKFETKEQKAILIQSHIRKFLKQRKYQKMKQATIRIQRQFKNFLYKSLFKRIVMAVKFIQNHWRKFKIINKI